MKTIKQSEDSSVKSNTAEKTKRRNLLLFSGSWWQMKDRLELFRWSAGFFSIATILMFLIGLLYISAYRLPGDLLSIIYTFTAFTSHFASLSIIAWVALIFPLIIFLPYRKFIISVCVLLSSAFLCIELLDAQVYTSHRFHFNLLTIRILGWKTWGFGIVYLFILLVFNSFVAKMSWNHFVAARKKSGLQ